MVRNTGSGNPSAVNPYAANASLLPVAPPLAASTAAFAFFGGGVRSSV